MKFEVAQDKGNWNICPGCNKTFDWEAIAPVIGKPLPSWEVRWDNEYRRVCSLCTGSAVVQVYRPDIWLEIKEWHEELRE